MGLIFFNRSSQNATECVKTKRPCKHVTLRKDPVELKVSQLEHEYMSSIFYVLTFLCLEMKNGYVHVRTHIQFVHNIGFVHTKAPTGASKHDMCHTYICANTWGLFLCIILLHIMSQRISSFILFKLEFESKYAVSNEKLQCYLS